MKKRLLLLAMIPFSALVLWAGKKDWYNDKPFAEWSDREVETMLSKSPWTQTHVHTISGGDAITRGAQMSGSTRGADLDVQTRYYFRAHWLSSRPVRMAFARMAIEANPDMAADQLEAFATGKMEDVVLSLRVDADAGGALGAQRFMQALSRLEDSRLMEETSLQTKSGKKIPLKEFKPPSNDGLGAQFVFERTMDGSPILDPADQEVRFLTTLRLPDNNIRLRLKYKLKDMLYQGELEY